MTEDGGTGMAIKPDGDIVSVYTDGGKKVHALMTLAVEEGGTKLDDFETALPDLYAVNGFKEVGRDPWSEQNRPEGWDKEVFRRYSRGEPDVVYMAYNPEYNPYYDGESEPRYSLTGDTNEGRAEPTRDRRGRDRGRGPAPLDGAPKGTSRKGKGPGERLKRRFDTFAHEYAAGSRGR